MKQKPLTLFLAFVTSVGTIFASTKIGDLYYDLDETNKTAEVARYSSYSGIKVIPNSVTYNSVTYSVTSIGSQAFYNCTGLTNVTIPNSVTSIGSTAFYNCSSLTSITIPNSVTSIGVGAFSDCTGLTSITIPNSVTSIGFSAFFNCTGLTSPVYNAYIFAFMPTSYSGAYTIPNGIESIADGAFVNCSNLTSISIPNSVTNIGGGAFEGCEGLTSVEIPEGATYIGDGAFSYCTGLTSITIPNSVTSIGRSVVSGCTGLTSVTAPTVVLEVFEDSWIYYTHSLKTVIFTAGELTYNVLGVLARSYKTLTTLDISAVSNTELDDEALKGFYNLQNVILPSNLTKIGYMAIADCKNLQAIDIPASVTEISQSAFENCRSLKTVTFGGQTAAPGRFNVPAAASQLQTIGNWAFYNCHELQNIEIPEGVTYIGDGAFYGCVYLENLSLPSSVQTIGDNTFALCEKLQQIIVNAVVPPSIQAKTFYDVNRQIPVYVPDECVDAYKNDTYWREFNIVGRSQMPASIDQISVSASSEKNTRKVLHDGQIYITRDEKVYTITGQEVR